MITQGTKAYSYIRFSSPEQANGDSYRRQRAAAETYCMQNGLELVRSEAYSFFDRGRSAYKGKHLDDTGQLARFLSFVEDGTIEAGSLLIVESLDRLSREHVRDALPRFLDLLKADIQIYTASDNKLYTKDYNEIDIVVSILQMSRAHSESSLKGERVSKAWQQKQNDARLTKKPLGHACPYWLKLEGGKYVAVSERVQVVNRIFRLATSGHGHRAIAKLLNADNVPIFGSLKRNKTGLWGSSSTGKILSNRAVIGEYQPTGLVDGKRAKLGEPVLDFFPAVIDEDLFFEAQSARSTRNVSKATKSSANFNVWQGLAKCSMCGESMHLVNKGRPPKGGKYLRCYGSSKGRCTNMQVELGRSERAFMEILAKVDSLSLVQDSQAKIQKEISKIDLQLAKIKKRQAEIESQILEINDDLPSFVMQAALRVDQESKTLKAQRNELKRDSQREKILNKEDFFSRLDLLTFEGRAKANYLLKALKVKVQIERQEDKVCYAIEVEGVLTFVMEQVSGKIDFYPYTGELTELLRSQGDDGAFAEMHSAMVTRVFDLLALMKERQRIQDMLNNPGVPIKF
ncbi:recombinase family protein [Pseudomonas frederiksbergensis]|uniref:recombinase family protein n=1 Tax=Pseudomonas frederiksbergensis TaxID=104087 RepID=UPI003D1A1825